MPKLCESSSRSLAYIILPRRDRLSIKRFRKKHLRVIIPRLPWLSPGDLICSRKKKKKNYPLAALSNEWMIVSPEDCTPGIREFANSFDVMNILIYINIHDARRNVEINYSHSYLSTGIAE